MSGPAARQGEAIDIAVALSLVDVVRRSARPHDAVLGYVLELHIARAKSPLEERLSTVIPPERMHPTVRAAVTHAG